MKTYSQFMTELLEATKTKRKSFNAEWKKKHDAFMADWKKKHDAYLAKAAAFKWGEPKPLNTSHEGEYSITSEDGRFVITSQLTYGGNFTFRLRDKVRPHNNWNNLSSLEDAKSQAMDYI